MFWSLFCCVTYIVSFLVLWIIFVIYVSRLSCFLVCTSCGRERNGSVVECLTRDRGAAGSSLTGVTALCP